MPDITHSNEVIINSLRYKLASPVKLQTMELLPERLPQGAYSYRSAPGRQRVVLADTTGGMGQHRFKDDVDPQLPNTFWFGVFDGFTPGSLTLPYLATSASRPAAVGVLTAVNALYEFNDQVWVSWGTDLYTWTGPSGTTWSAIERSLAAAPTDAVIHENAATKRVFVLQGSAIDYQSAGGAWSRITTSVNANYGVSYNAFLWTISTDGTFLRNASGTQAIASWTTRQTLPVGNSTVVRLFLYREADGTPAIHAKTTEGLWVYDDTNDIWYPSEVRYPRHPNIGRGVDVWRGLSAGDRGQVAGTYIPVGMSVYGYVAGDQASIYSVGLDRNDGVPDGYDGYIRSMYPAHMFNLALIDATGNTATDATTGRVSGNADILSGADVIFESTGITWMAAWTGDGWMPMWESAAAQAAGRHVIVSQAYGGRYRAYWDAEGVLYWMNLPTATTNPRENLTIERAASGATQWPWHPGSGAGNQDVLASVISRVSSATSTETVAIAYGTDLADSTWTTLVTRNSNGLVTTDLDPDADSNAEGVLFDFLRLRATYARGSTNTTRPILEYLAFEFVPGLPKTYLWQCAVDLREAFGQRSTQTMLTELTNLADPQIMRSVIWRSQSSSTNDVHMCKLVKIEGAGTGNQWEDGVYQLTFIEV